MGLVGKEFLINIVANNQKPKMPIQIIFAILLAVATIFTVVIAIMPKVLPMIVEPTPTELQASSSTPASILSTPLFTETSSLPTNTPTLAWTSTPTATDTPAFTFTPKYTSTPQRFPDLIVTEISASTCTKDQRVTPEKLYIKLSFIVRNIGPGSTRPLGPFSVRVNLILGQRHYSLEEWASDFNGVIGSSNMDIANLDPNGDVKLNVSIDLKGNTNFGVEVIANSGLYIIPESNITNNTLIQGFSVICS